jgi:hypothetical protein
VGTGYRYLEVANMLQRFPESCRQLTEFLHLRVIVFLLLLFTIFFLLLIQKMITVDVPVYMALDVMLLRPLEGAGPSGT